MKKPVYTIGGDAGKQYWLEEDGLAVTGDLYGIFALMDLKKFVTAYNTLEKIKEELPENPKLPLTTKIKKLVEEGLGV